MAPYRLLLTRPRPQSEALARDLAAFGMESLVEPLLEVRFFNPPTLDFAGVQAVLVTSANGLAALAKATPRRDLPLYAVGPASAAAAKAAGFAEVTSAEGDGRDLAALLRARLDPAAGKLLHATGTAVAGNLDECLKEAGFDYVRKELYEAWPAASFSPACREALGAGSLDGVVFFSPRTGTTFVRLAAAEGLAAACGRLKAFCLSIAVRERVVGLPWRAVAVAAAPNQAALLELLEREVHRK